MTFLRLVCVVWLAISAPLLAQPACSPDIVPATADRAELAAILAGGKPRPSLGNAGLAKLLLELRIAAKEDDIAALRGLLPRVASIAENRVQIEMKLAVDANDLPRARKAWRDAVRLHRESGSKNIVGLEYDRALLLHRTSLNLAAGEDAAGTLRALRDTEVVLEALRRKHAARPRNMEALNGALVSNLAVQLELIPAHEKQALRDRIRDLAKATPPASREPLVAGVPWSLGSTQVRKEDAAFRTAYRAALLKQARSIEAAAAAQLREDEKDAEFAGVNANMAAAWPSGVRFVDAACVARLEQASTAAYGALTYLVEYGADAEVFAAGMAAATRGNAYAARLPDKFRVGIVTARALLASVPGSSPPADQIDDTDRAMARRAAEELTASCFCARYRDWLRRWP